MDGSEKTDPGKEMEIRCVGRRDGRAREEDEALVGIRHLMLLSHGDRRQEVR